MSARTSGRSFLEFVAPNLPNARVDRRCPGGTLVGDEVIVADDCSKREPKGSVRGRTRC